MEPILYFAYGSNMLAQRLTARCSSARVHCIGAVAGYALAFSKKSKDGSGKATLIASKDRASSVQGVVFELARNELDELDRSEGRGKGYERIVKVRAAHGATLKAITYVADPSFVDTKLKPYDWYLDLVVKGAEQHGFPEKCVESIGWDIPFPDLAGHAICAP